MKKLITGKGLGRRLLLILFGTLAILIVLSLLVLEKLGGERKSGAFQRVFAENLVEAVDSLNLGFNSYYFSGAYEQCIYLGNITAPLHLLRIGRELKDTAHLRIGGGAIKTWSLDSKLSVGSSHYTVVNRAERVVLSGTFDQMADLFRTKTDYLLADFVTVGDGTGLVIRTVGTDGYYHLARYTPGESLFFPDTNILERKVDGRFCVDGMLSFDTEHGKVLYAYYYRNQFVCLDTLLNVIYRAFTIDSNKYAPLKVASYDRIKTLASTPYVVNRLVITGDSSVLIHSKTRADNESREQFKTYDVIDVYNLFNGQYQHSLQLPNPKRRNLRSMYFHGGYLFVIYDRMLVRHQIRRF